MGYVMSPHEALGYRTTADVFQETMPEAMNVQAMGLSLNWSSNLSN